MTFGAGQADFAPARTTFELVGVNRRAVATKAAGCASDHGDLDR